MAKTGENWQTAAAYVRAKKAPESALAGDSSSDTEINAAVDLANEAHAARAAFYERFQTAHVAGEAYKSFRHTDLFVAAMNAYEGLANIEARAVSAHQRAFGRPIHAEMLRCACDEAQFPFERPDVDPDHWEFWAERVYRAANPPSGSRGRELLAHACRYARADRFFMAAQMLRMFVESLNGTMPASRATVLASKPRSLPERPPICGVTYVYGRSTAKSPFGRKGVNTLCGSCVWSSAIDYVSLTNDAAEITCPECQAVLDNGGFPTGPGSGMCSD